MGQAKPTTPRRAASKEERREQLIRATIKCIARKGMSGTTMADITTAAGLSLGIVNLHFQSKEKLLVETLRYVADEYKSGWDTILQDADLSPAEKLVALIEHDFSASIIQRNKLAVWFAFWGEARSRPTYQKICNQADLQTNTSMYDLCQALIEDGDYPHVDADLVATGYTALCDGLWLDILVTPQDMDGGRALRISRNYFTSFFPQHFNP
jgi:TetR/AcrR family transcriptional repressor of bet genes